MTDQTERNSAAELFADDLVRIIMDRLSVRLQPGGVMTDGVATEIEVLLIDTKTSHAVRCSGPRLQIAQPRVGVQFDFGARPNAAPYQNGGW